MKNNVESIVVLRHYSEWIEKCATTRSPHTVRAYEVTIESYMTFLEKELNITPVAFTAAKCLSKDYIEKWMEHLLKTKGCSAKTCNARLASFRAFLKYLSQKDAKYAFLYLDSQNIEQYKVVKKRYEGMTEMAIKALLAEPDLLTNNGIRDSVLMTILYVTAARISELLSIRLKDLHMGENPHVTVIGKRMSIRTLYLPEECLENLKLYIKRFHNRSNKDAYLFYSPIKGSNYPMSAENVNKFIKKYAKTAKVKCPDIPDNTHAHQFRHAMATHWLNAGFNIAEVSQMLGHANIETTMIYLDITLDTVKKAIIKVGSDNIQKAQCKWKKKKNVLKLSSMFKRQ